MIKLNRTQISVLLLGLLSLAITAYFYPKLPDQIPMNWDFEGNVAYNGKNSIWGLGALGLILGVVFLITPHLDPRKKNYEKFQGAYDQFCVVMELFCLVMLGMVLSESFQPGRIPISTLVTTLIGLLLAWSGNILPKVKNNFFMGIKNPWTLSDPEVWNRTHRLAGKLFFVGGILMCLMPWVLPGQLLFPLTLGITMFIACVPSVCSFLWYRQRQK